MTQCSDSTEFISENELPRFVKTIQIGAVILSSVFSQLITINNAAYQGAVLFSQPDAKTLFRQKPFEK